MFSQTKRLYYQCGRLTDPVSGYVNVSLVRCHVSENHSRFLYGSVTSVEFNSEAQEKKKEKKDPVEQADEDMLAASAEGTVGSLSMYSNMYCTLHHTAHFYQQDRNYGRQ